jgi:MFS family permease
MDVGGGGGQRAAGLAQTRSLLPNRSFRRLWAAQFSGVTVSYGLTLAGAVLVEQQTSSSGQIGLLLLSAILPAFLASLVAGAVVDHWGQVRVLMASYSARALVALGFWFGTALLPPGQARAVVYATNMLGAIFAQFAISAELSLLPDLVGRRRLMSANSLLQFSILLAEGLGIVVLSPLVIKLAGVPAVGIVGAGLSALGLVLVAALPRDRPSTRDTAGGATVWAGLRTEFQAGWRTIAQDRVLRLVTAQATLAAALVLVLLSLVPGLAARHLGVRVEDAPLLSLPAGLGFLLGAVLMSRLEGRFSRLGWIDMGLVGLGFAVGLLATLSGDHRLGGLWLILPVILGLGLAMALVVVPARTVLQERPPPALRGRVIAAQLALSHAVSVLPLLLGGTLADRLGIQPVLGILGVLAAGAGVVGLHQIRRQSRLSAKG